MGAPIRSSFQTNFPGHHHILPYMHTPNLNNQAPSLYVHFVLRPTLQIPTYNQSCLAVFIFILQIVCTKCPLLATIEHAMPYSHWPVRTNQKSTQRASKHITFIYIPKISWADSQCSLLQNSQHHRTLRPPLGQISNYSQLAHNKCLPSVT